MSIKVTPNFGVSVLACICVIIYLLVRMSSSTQYPILFVIRSIKTNEAAHSFGQEITNRIGFVLYCFVYDVQNGLIWASNIDIDHVHAASTLCHTDELQ